MILLCGIPSEPPLAMVAEAAEAAGVEYQIVNQRHSTTDEISLTLTSAGLKGSMVIDGRYLELESVSGVFARLTDLEVLPEIRPNPRRPPAAGLVEKASVFSALLCAWLEVTPSRVLNRSSAMGSNSSKPFQAQAAMQCGFKVPPTLVTNDPEEVRDFLVRHGRVIFKSTSAVRSIVKELNSEHLSRLDRIRALPTQFQAYIPGTNLRIHVIGERIEATEVECDGVDYRYAHRDGSETKMRPVRLSEELTDRCLHLSRFLDLPLCGIDLKRTPEGEVYCFEVNPSPAFSYYQDHTGQPIATAIFEYLSGKAN